MRRALVLALKEKADVLHTNGLIFRSEMLELHAPSVVKLRYYVKVPYRSRASLSRRAVFVRDHYECQYCGRPAGLTTVCGSWWPSTGSTPPGNSTYRSRNGTAPAPPEPLGVKDPPNPRSGLPS